jgi:hypothetical protein
MDNIESTTTNAKEWLTVKEVMEQLHVNEAQLAEYILDGKLLFTMTEKSPLTFPDVFNQLTSNHGMFRPWDVEEFLLHPEINQAAEQSKFSADWYLYKDSSQEGEVSNLPSHAGLIWDKARRRVSVDKTWEDLDSRQADMWDRLWNAAGGWVAGSQIDEYAAQIKYSMPEIVRNEIDSDKHNGYRLKRFIPA